MIKSRLILLFLVGGIFLLDIEVKAQTEPMYSQYMYNMLGVNPAYAGNREATSFNFFQRNQWIGLKGAPKTTSISIDKAANEGKIGLGFQAYDDRLGVESATGFNAILSSRVKVSDKGILSGGISVGLMNYRITLNDVLNRYTPTDPSFASMAKPSQWNPSIGMGIYYNTDKMYLGISTPSILRSRLAKYENFVSGVQKIDDFHLFATAGFVYEINEDVKLKPSTMLKIVSGAPIEADINMNIWLKDMLGIGGSYRTGDAFVGMVEVQATDNLRFGYAYDIPFSPLKYYARGSHELMLRYEFGNFKTRIKSTRYF